MAEIISVKTEGFKELEAVLIEMGEDLCYGKTASKVLLPAIRNAMQPVLQTAKQLAPYDEGNTTTPHLRDSIKLSARVPTARDQRSIYSEPNDIAIGIVSARTDKRGISQEFGNKAVAPKPYLRPALESTSSRVINILGAFLTYKIQKYKSKKV
jgi:HK97 gp10 family phage protein